jgi:hypothetical protein
MDQKPKQLENPKEYQKWYYENITRPKRDKLNPGRAEKRPTRKKPGETIIHICAFPACGKEFVARSFTHKYCSQSCSIRHTYDRKHGIIRKSGEDYCPCCQQLKPAAEFPPNENRSSGHNGLCTLCHNEYYRKKQKEAYHADIEKYREKSRQNNRKRRKRQII